VVLIDNCSNANLVTRKFLNNFIKNYKIIGTITGKVHQVMSDTEEGTYEIVLLEVNIGALKVEANFRILEKEEPFYDIIISLKTQSDYRMIVDVVDKCLSIKNKRNELEHIAPLEDISLIHTQLMLNYLYDNQFTISANTVFTPISEEKKHIDEELLEHMDIEDNNLKLKLKEGPITHSDMIAETKNNLEQSKLLPNHIELRKDKKLIKQKDCTPPQIQLSTLNKKVKRLINKILIPFFISHGPLV